MDSIMDFIDKFLAMVLLPATFYGAGGAFMHARRKGKPLSQTALEVVGGSITANMLCPLVQDLAPEKWHYTLFFLVGWGGLELVSRLYEAVAQALERRIKNNVGGSRSGGNGE